MRLEITNIGKIQKAALEMRGITVIAGDNNTGKSTYGKVLYCMFNAFCNAESAIHKKRRNNIEDIIFNPFHDPHLPKTAHILINNIVDHQSSTEEISTLLKEAINNKTLDDVRIKDIDSIVEGIIRSSEVTDVQIQKTILTRFLKSEFGGRIVHVNHAEDPGTISLSIRGNVLSASIKNNECTDFTDNIGIIYEVLYIDTPFVMDEMNRDAAYRENGHRVHLIKRLSKSFADISVVDEILTKQKLQRLLAGIRNVVSGEFRQNHNEWLFQEEGLNKPLEMINISTGMKPFLIIKRLLETGERDLGVLVFDEPEIHLHPEWQLKYAELLVLLQKEFKVHILLTTHSPYFLNAIEVFSQRNNISNRCNYYLTDTQGDACTVNEVTDNLDLAYQKLAKPFQELENLRYRED
jgi:predicted ATPase